MSEKLPRDKRLDVVGCIKLLADKVGEEMREAVKKSMDAKSIERAVGDYFEGLLVPPGEKTVIDAGKFMKLLDGMEISRKDFLGCISVKTKEAKELLSAKQLDAVSSMEKTPASLRVSIIKDIVVVPKAAAAAVLAAVSE
jgi:hypothetical protein